MSRIKKGIKSHKILKRKLRREMTTAEQKIWVFLKARQFQSLKFRRQHGIGPYIVDFYCPEKAIVIEIDGDVHAKDSQKQIDKNRKIYLKQLGLTIIRYNNEDVIKNIKGVLEDLSIKILNYSTSPSPSLQRRGKNEPII